MRTNKVQFTVKSSDIAYMHVQIGATAFGAYQINKEFCSTRGHLTEAEISQLQDSFQINEGTELLSHEVGGDITYTTTETQSNLTKLQSAFVIKEVPSTNLLPPDCVRNHLYIHNGSLSSTGGILLQSYNKCALLAIPIESPGQYILSANKTIAIGNKVFGIFGKGLFVDENGVYVGGNYSFTGASGVPVGIDPSKATISGEGTTRVRFNILDESIKTLYIPL
jgi:hypothetical protein